MTIEEIVILINDADQRFWNKDPDWSDGLKPYDLGGECGDFARFVYDAVFHGDQTAEYAAERLVHSQKPRTITNESDLHELVKEIMSGQGSEAYSDFLVSEFDRYCKHPEKSGLIFWPEEEMTSKEVARLAWNG